MTNEEIAADLRLKSRKYPNQHTAFETTLEAAANVIDAIGAKDKEIAELKLDLNYAWENPWQPRRPD